jgi:hypothetical protein
MRTDPVNTVRIFRTIPPSARCGQNTAYRVDNFKATDVASVSKVIHTDNQLQSGQFGKTAYSAWIRCIAVRTACVVVAQP